MKILGHAYVATRVIDGNNQLLIIGALLPEMFPYIPNDVFDYQEFHEGGKRLLDYLEANYPQKRDLALGLLSHGVEFGADKYSRESESFVARERESLIQDIGQANSVDLETAGKRVHNYIGLGIDYLLIKNNPQLVQETQEALKALDIEELSHLLAGAFGKDEVKVGTMVNTLFKDIYRWEDLSSAEGIARIWVRQATGLPEGDRVDVLLSAKLVERFALLIEGKWQGFLETITDKVKENLSDFSLDKERETNPKGLERQA